jgi:hypothetical protein
MGDTMKFFVDLARDLALVTIVLTVICAAVWMVLRRQDPESGNDSTTVPPD